MSHASHLDSHGHSSGHASNGLHPKAFVAMIVLAAVYVLSAWIGFGRGGHVDYLLFVITGFVAAWIGLLGIAATAWRHNRVWTPDHADDLDEWEDQEFDIGQGHMTGRTALVEILLPLAAVAFGMTVFAILAMIMG